MRGPIDPALVLIADEDPRVLEELRAALRIEGAQVITCRRAAQAVSAVDFHRPSAVVVDVSLDDGHGWDVVRAAREHGELPVVVLDQEGDGVTRRTAFAAGADDVVAKPLAAGEVATRVLALVRRTQLERRGGPVLRHRDLVVDVASREVRLSGRPLSLTAQQFAILRALLEAGGATLERSHLLARVEPLDDEPPSERAIDLHISRLRKRLGDTRREPRFIEAVYGVGYRLATADRGSENALGGRAEAVLDALPDALLVIDRSLTIRFANAAAERLLGTTRLSLTGRRCGEILDCRTRGGRRLDGPRCLGRAVLAGRGALHDEPAIIRGPQGPIDIACSYGQVRLEGDEPLLSITLRPRERTA